MPHDELIEITCPYCTSVLGCTREMIGQAMQCPVCRKQFEARSTNGDDEAVAEIARSVASGVSKTGGFLRRLAGKGVAAGREAVERRRRRAELADYVRRFLASPEGFRVEYFIAKTRRLELPESEIAAAAGTHIDAYLRRNIASLDESSGSCVATGEELMRLLALLPNSEDFARQIEAKLARARHLDLIRSGKVKPVASVDGLVVRNSEVVWYQTDGQLIGRKNGAFDLHAGRLFICTGRIVFVSPQHPGEWDLSNINAVDRQDSRVRVTGKTARHSFEFESRDPVMLVEYLQFAVRAYHRQVDVGFERNSRRIPQDVRDVVYRRDGGRCVECGAEDYLEFDHVIPFSRGGANTAENVQLLCRRCNLRKSDRV